MFLKALAVAASGTSFDPLPFAAVFFPEVTLFFSAVVEGFEAAPDFGVVGGFSLVAVFGTALDFDTRAGRGGAKPEGLVGRMSGL